MVPGREVHQNHLVKWFFHLPLDQVPVNMWNKVTHNQKQYLLISFKFVLNRSCHDNGCKLVQTL